MDADDSPLLLSVAEARALGCLIEKQATTPDVYPLTVNAAHAAVNQKTAREPVLSLDVGTVHHALRELERKGLAKQVFSSRAERYEHRAEIYFSLPKPQVTLLGLLLLRGTQTVHELLARSERMHAFADAEDVRHHLERLMQHARSRVVLIPRAPGQREDRFAHQLCGEVDVASVQSRAPARIAAEPEVPGLAARVEALEAEVATLRAQLERLLADRDG